MSLNFNLKTKEEVDVVLQFTIDRVVVLRFGNEKESLRHDNILDKCREELRNMAVIFFVESELVKEYMEYFEIVYLPSTLFFFNTQHMKVNFQTEDQTKFIGEFYCKQDLIDLVEIIYRGAMKGKYLVESPIPREHMTGFNLYFNDE